MTSNGSSHECERHRQKKTRSSAKGFKQKASPILRTPSCFEPSRGKPPLNSGPPPPQTSPTFLFTNTAFALRLVSSVRSGDLVTSKSPKVFTNSTGSILKAISSEPAHQLSKRLGPHSWLSAKLGRRHFSSRKLCLYRLHPHHRRWHQGSLLACSSSPQSGTGAFAHPDFPRTPHRRRPQVSGSRASESVGTRFFLEQPQGRLRFLREWPRPAACHDA